MKMGQEFDPYAQPLSPTSGIISSGQTNLAQLKTPVSQDHILKQAKGIPKLTGLSSYEYILDQGQMHYFCKSANSENLCDDMVTKYGNFMKESVQTQSKSSHMIELSVTLPVGIIPQ